jgi:transcription elongation GreA/GreB family factor
MRNGRKQIFQIVGEDEADPSKGRISYVSPLARAIMNKEVGDTAMLGDSEIELLAASSD